MERFACSSCSSSRLHCQFTYITVEQHSKQQDQANESFVPVCIYACEDDALLNDAEDQRPEHGTDSRAIATREQYPSNDRRDDRIELLALAALDIGVGKGHNLDNRQQTGAEGRA